MKIKFSKAYSKRRISFRFIAVFAVFFGTLSAVSFLIFRFRPVFQEKAECATKNKANYIINNAVADAISGIDADDFVNISVGENNAISAINTNTVAINTVKTKIYENLSEYLKESGNSTVYIPVGSLTKYPALQGFGYKIPVRIQFDTTFNVDFSEALKDAGINQVYYETYIETSASFDIISALMVSETTVTAKVPVSQTLIVGTVPNQYGLWCENSRR